MIPSFMHAKEHATLSLFLSETKAGHLHRIEIERERSKQCCTNDQSCMHAFKAASLSLFCSVFVELASTHDRQMQPDFSGGDVRRWVRNERKQEGRAQFDARARQDCRSCICFTRTSIYSIEFLRATRYLKVSPRETWKADEVFPSFSHYLRTLEARV